MWLVYLQFRDAAAIADPVDVIHVRAANKKAVQTIIDMAHHRWLNNTVSPRRRSLWNMPASTAAARSSYNIPIRVT